MSRFLFSLMFLLPAVGCAPDDLGTFQIDQEVSRVVIDVEEGNVIVHGQAEPGASADYELQYDGKGRAELVQTLERGVLTLGIDCPDEEARCGGAINLRVDEAAAVEVISGAGPVFVSATQGDVDVRAAGNVDVDWLTGNLKVATTGSFSGFAVNSPVVDIALEQGDATLLMEAPPETLTISTDAGDIDASIPPEAYAITAESASGEVTIEGLSPDGKSPRTVTVTTGEGNVKLAVYEL